MKKNENGFVLVTALVLLAILTLLGISSAFKAVVAMKVSRTGVDMERATAVANSGLTQIYWYWLADGNAAAGGIKERNDMMQFINNQVAAPPAVYKPLLTPNNLGAAPSDATIQDPASGIHVFTLSAGAMTKVPNADWGVGSDPQVAVWMTTFDQPNNPGDYPYSTPVDLTAVNCPTCRIVTYALGRSGYARRLVRETQSAVSQLLNGVSAMSNAPAGASFNQICGIDPVSGNPGANTPVWPEASGSGNGSALIEVTQAPYLLGDAPSGTALASNTDIATGGKNFRAGHSSLTGTNFESPPLLMYSGHDTYSAFKVDYANGPRDNTGVDLPNALLPQKLVNAPLMGGNDEIDYFSSANAQLFDMDTYRWGAEQFTCQDPSKPDGQYGNGMYCSKGEKLRQALVRMGYPAYAPVTGRLTIAQIQYNIANAIPMFGLVRLMFPAAVESGGDVSTCTVDGNNRVIRNHVIEGKNGGDPANSNKNSQWNAGFDKLMACKKDCSYTGAMPNPDLGTPTGIPGVFAPPLDGIADVPYGFAPNGATVKTDTDGDLGSNARLIVYGTLLIDYFADYNIGTLAANAPDYSSSATAYNTVYDPAAGERLLTPLESPDVYLAVEHNMMINPVMPRFGGADPLPFPTAANTIAPAGSTNDLAGDGLVNMVNVNNVANGNINLASPYDGYFPWAEGLVPPAGVGNVGTMRLMSRATTADNPSNEDLVMMAKNIGPNTQQNTVNADMTNLLALLKPVRAGDTAGTEADVLHYYYKLMKETLDRTRANDWPIAPWPGNDLSANFCIGAEDCGTRISNPTSAQVNNHMGDKVHLMFPTGYVHGWKVALAALDINANEWNSVLTAGVGIAGNTGLYKQLLNGCSQFGAVGGGGCAAGKPFNFGVDSGALSVAAVQSIQDNAGLFYYATSDPVTGYALMDYDWQDIPSTMYSGGLLDMHAHSNMNGIIYTPGPLEWEPGNSNYDSGIHLSYISGSIITGYGAYTKNKTTDDRYVLVFDMQAVDNINVNQVVIVLRRYNWQMLP